MKALILEPVNSNGCKGCWFDDQKLEMECHETCTVYKHKQGCWQSQWQWHEVELVRSNISSALGPLYAIRRSK